MTLGDEVQVLIKWWIVVISWLSHIGEKKEKVGIQNDYIKYKVVVWVFI